jgi:hypothetical protein
VDERFELTSIVFRLAGAEEYVNNEVVNYAESIDAYFAPYKEHALIKFVKEIRERDEIAYNAVSGSTYLLEIKNSKLFFNQEKTDLTKYLENDTRWTEQTLHQYAMLLNTFYRDTKFKKFYNQHKDLYAETEKRFDELLKTIQIDWFQSFWGKLFGNFDVYVSLSNGKSNYALRSYNRDGFSEQGIIIGCPQVDKDGMPTFISNYDNTGNPFFNAKTLSVVIHEFMHYFTNQLIPKYNSQMIEAAEKIFPYVKEQLRAVAYGDASAIIWEGLNELFVNMYFREHPTGMEKYNIARDERYGFVWMRRAVQLMDNFYQYRTLYPCIEDFMPQIISFINHSGNTIEQIMDEYTHANPYVVNIFPCLNSIVSPDIKEIRIDFSHPMWNSSGIYQSNVVTPEGEQPHWNEDKKAFIIPVRLEKNEDYRLVLPAGVFQSFETFPMKEDFEVIFKTGEK